MVSQESKEELRDSDRLLRRVPVTDPKFIKEDGTPSSLAFLPKKNAKGLSVNVKRMTSFRKSIVDREKFKLYQVSAGQVRSLNHDCNCSHDPLPDNRAHALIAGLNRKYSRKLARMASYCGFFNDG